MCKYCEKNKEQNLEPLPLYDRQKTEPFGESIKSNIGDDWEARIYHLESITPQLILTSRKLGDFLLKDSTASLFLPIRYCPICGQKLGQSDPLSETEQYESATYPPLDQKTIQQTAAEIVLKDMALKHTGLIQIYFPSVLTMFDKGEKMDIAYTKLVGYMYKLSESTIKDYLYNHDKKEA